MISVYTCRKCESAFSVPSLDPDTRLLKKHMRCPNYPKCPGRVYLNAETNIKPKFATTPLTALALYQASLGIGLPHEKKCGPKDLKDFMVGAKITAIHTDKTPDPKRSIIHSITLDNGKIIHLASSTAGATIFKVTEVRNAR